MGSYGWPSREQWAKNQRTVYYDLFDDLPVSAALHYYATPHEIAAIEAKLKDIYREEGRRMKAAKPAHDAVLAVRPGLH